MNLVLFRHGPAEDVAPDHRDASRRLTPEGEKRTLAAARGLSRLLETPAIILTSPLVRAMQTADMLGKVLSVEAITEPILAQSDLAPILPRMRASDQTVILVGHEPTLSGLIERCVAGRVTHRVQMKKAGAAMLQLDADHGAELLWLATPAMLRQLGRDG